MNRKINKKLNTILFILGATLFNIFIIVGVFLLLLGVYAGLLMRVLPADAGTWAIPLSFIAAIAVSFIVYRFTLNRLLKKIDMERYFDPVFSYGNRRW